LLRILILLLTLFSTCPALGHGLFFLDGAAADTLAVGHGETDAAGHGGLRRLPADQVARCLLVDRTGQVRPVALDSGWVVVPADGMAAFAVVDWGWWAKTPDGTVQAHPDTLANVLQSWRSRDTVKRLRAWHPLLTRPLGDALQICPVDDPFTKRPGDKLRVCVWFEGRPVAGAVVAYGHDPRGTSGADGCVNIRLRHGGRQILRATLRRPLDAPPHAEDVRTATLDFHLEAR
jgi:nickel transport protein